MYFHLKFKPVFFADISKYIEIPVLEASIYDEICEFRNFLLV